MPLHHESAFETEICEHLGTHGWFYAEGDAAGYDRARALFPADVIAWVQDRQPKAWAALVKQHGAKAETALLDRLRECLNHQGTLAVLRHGIDLLGVRGKLLLARFKPAHGLNPDILADYQGNRLRVVRQVRSSQHNENRIDLVLFLNGIPVATIEIKTDFTQSVEDAVDQYRFDRHPQPKGQAKPEPLLSFPNGALVHFAVSNDEVRMTTRLEGPATTFLPFNRGHDGGKGNPPNPAGGHRTAYLWQDIWERESWLEILGRYLVTKRNDKQRISGLIFPRFHQLDGARKLIETIRREGPGGRFLTHRFHYSGKYLIQNSAGSGKTNSIAWTAHFLADLHDEHDNKLFDTVLVVSDRNVLDDQLQEAIFDFERTKGVVATITSDNGSKSGQLAQALAGGKKIVVCTLQTFPHALKLIEELAATQGKRFAVIADEAHSSQTGETAAKLKAVLSAEELAELNDGGEISHEDILAAQMANRAKNSNITYIAFTATPKAKTMELFGRPPDLTRPTGPDNLPAPFHVYSMRQAIEEGFILDVLRNYTPYSLAFKLAQQGEHGATTEVDKDEATQGLIRWVKLHPYNIAQKVQIVVEHFRQNVAPLLDGQAKAMVVVGSRLEAVRWKLAIDDYIKRQGYPIGTLAAFSGEVNDPESGPDPFTETSPALNPTLKGRDIREAFKTEEFQILLVANKFQTGFDQPLLCGMYIDKRLSGIQVVQTLSRLNRAYPGKDTTYVLDFVNDPEEVLASFRVYYETAELAGVTDPHLVLTLKEKLDASGHYDEGQVDRVVAVLLDPNAKQSALVAALEPVVEPLLKQYKFWQAEKVKAQRIKDQDAEQAAQNQLDALILFKRDAGAFLRLYSFLSQIFDYGSTAVEKRYLFFKPLLPLLAFGREREAIDYSTLTLTHHGLRNQGRRDLDLGGEGVKLKPAEYVGSGQVRDREKALLDEIIARVNELFQGELTDDDKLVYVNHVLKTKLMESEILHQQAMKNSKQQFADSPDLAGAILDAIMDALDAHTVMSRQALDSEQVRAGLRDILLGPGQLYEALKAQGSRTGDLEYQKNPR
ncbi:MAG: type I restriction endonuclease subunit R [Methylococcus sp.]